MFTPVSKRCILCHLCLYDMANNTVIQYRQAIGLYNNICTNVTIIGFRCVTLSLLLLFLLLMLILLCGDVAENPGPAVNVKICFGLSY